MKTLGNILWFLICGFIMGLTYIILGLFWCITIIGIPFGKQCFKLGAFIMWPFGKDIDDNFGRHPILNVIWILFGGLELAFGFVLFAAFWAITIVGLPFAKQCIKFAQLSLMPFGAEIK